MMSGVSQLITLLLVYTVAIAAVAADLTRCPVEATVQRFAPLGQLTYSIYMWHLLFISFLLNVIGDKFLHGNALFTAILVVVTCYICIFITSYLSFFFIETPARRWIDKKNLFKPVVTV